MPVSTTAHTMPQPSALNDRRAASALTVTQEASTCNSTGKSGQTRWMLRCGQASFVLRRIGRVVIRGTYVETRAKGVNRIKGGSVHLN